MPRWQHHTLMKQFILQDSSHRIKPVNFWNAVNMLSVLWSYIISIQLLWTQPHNQHYIPSKVWWEPATVSLVNCPVLCPFTITSVLSLTLSVFRPFAHADVFCVLPSLTTPTNTPQHSTQVLNVTSSSFLWMLQVTTCFVIAKQLLV